MNTQPCSTSAFIIASAFYREAGNTARQLPVDKYLVFGDQAGEGWLGVQDASRRLGEWIEVHACETVNFDESSDCWSYFWDDTPEVAALFAAIDCAWPPSSKTWVAQLDAAIARHFPLL